MGRIEACNNVYFLKSAEGLYITQDTDALSLPTMAMDASDISKLMLSDAHADKYEFKARYRKLSHEVCLGVINALNILKFFDKKYFKVIDYKNNMVVIYTKYNQIWVPKCYPRDNFSLREIPITNASCTEDLPVQFYVGQMLVNGFLDTNIIIKNSTRRVDCSNIEQLYFLNGSIIKR